MSESWWKEVGYPFLLCEIPLWVRNTFFNKGNIWHQGLFSFCTEIKHKYRLTWWTSLLIKAAKDNDITSDLPGGDNQRSLSWSTSWPGPQASLLWRSWLLCQLPVQEESSRSPGGPNKQRGAAMNNLRNKDDETVARYTWKLESLLHLTSVLHVFISLVVP